MNSVPLSLSKPSSGTGSLLCTLRIAAPTRSCVLPHTTSISTHPVATSTAVTVHRWNPSVVAPQCATVSTSTKPGRASSQSLIVRTAIRFRSVVPGLVRLLTFLLTGTWSAANNRSNVAALARLSSTSVSTSILNSLNLTSREASSPTNGCSRLAPMPPAASWTTLSAAATLGPYSTGLPTRAPRPPRLCPESRRTADLR